MSLSTRNYSKESRSSSHYSRSASYHTSGNNNYSSSYRYCNFTDDDRPLSTRLIERDHSWPSLSWDWHFDDPFFFDRIRWRLDDPLFKWNFGLARPIPIYYRSWNNSTSRIIPVQYTPSSKNRRHPKKIDDDLSSSSSKRPDESSMIRENRISSENWPPKLEPPTRKRTSMTILVQRPWLDQSEVPYYRQTLPTPTYPQSARFDYY